jgi:hypothetical protein
MKSIICHKVTGERLNHPFGLIYQLDFADLFYYNDTDITHIPTGIF